MKKSLYGLKQSSREWFGRFAYVVGDFGLEKDHFVFWRQNQRKMLLLVLYVDDIIITGDNGRGLQILNATCKSIFRQKTLNLCSIFEVLK